MPFIRSTLSSILRPSSCQVTDQHSLGLPKACKRARLCIAGERRYWPPTCDKEVGVLDPVRRNIALSRLSQGLVYSFHYKRMTSSSALGFADQLIGTIGRRTLARQSAGTRPREQPDAKADSNRSVACSSRAFQRLRPAHAVGLFPPAVSSVLSAVHNRPPFTCNMDRA